MTKNFNKLFLEIAAQLDEDIKSDIEKRESLAGYKNDRDEEGYEDLITPFKTDKKVVAPKVVSRWKQPVVRAPKPMKERIPENQAFREVSFRLNGIDIKKYGYPNIFKAATAKYGAEAVQGATSEGEIGVEDADALEEAFLTAIKNNTNALTKVEDGTFRVIVPKEMFASDDYPASFMYNDITMHKARVMHHKPTDNVIVIYAPAGMAEESGRKAYSLLIKMLSDMIVGSGFYAKLSDPALFESTYGLESAELNPEKPLIEAGVKPEDVKILKHIMRFTVPSKPKTLETSVSLTQFGPIDMELLFRAENQELDLKIAMKAIAEQVNDFLNSVFSTSPEKFFTVNNRMKNFSDQYLARTKAKAGYLEKQKARLAAKKLEGSTEAESEESEAEPAVPETEEPKV